jgi:DNA polymerase elongation subunit (family B)
MIIEAYNPDYTGSDYIYKRWRDSEGNLIEETVTDFRPYFWIKSSTSPRFVDNIIDQFPGSRVDWDDRAEALRTGEELVKVYAFRQREVKDMARMFGKTWEADLSLEDRYLIDKVEKMPNWKPRVWHFDLEWCTKTKQTTVMAVIDNYNNRLVAFCWKKDNPNGLFHGDYHIEQRATEYEYKGEQIPLTYERHLYGSEQEMHDAFLHYMDECNPDIFVAHAMMWADLPHLVERMTEYKRLSPLGRVLPGRNGYDYVDQPIYGRLCFDTASPMRSGSGFERVWKDSGKPQLKNLKLDTIARVCGYGGKLDMDVHTGWTERFDDYVDYCMVDTFLLKHIDEDNHVLNFFLSLQEFTGVSFPSCHSVTRFARGLLQRRTDWKAPTHSGQEKEDYEGAFIPPPKPGRYEGVACVDYKGLYPSLILSHNLSWESQVPKSMAGEPNVRELPDGTCWRQDVDALLPSMVTELFEVRDQYKKNMKEAPTESERNGWNTLQLAVKRVMASLYGATASPYWGWCDFDIASAITACGRQAIKGLMEESENAGYKALYGHTDSAFVQVPFDEAHDLAKHLTETIQREHQASHLIVEFEAYMPYWIVGGKNLYYGICSYPPEDEGKAKSARWGKISTLAPISKNLENDVLTAICSGASEEEVIGMVRPLAKKIQRGNVELKEIATTQRLQKSLDKYRHSDGRGVKAARYYNQHIVGRNALGDGDSVNYVYVNQFPEGKPNHIIAKNLDTKEQVEVKVDVVAFENDNDLDGFGLDYDKMVDRLIKRKLKPIFKALDWDLERASGAAMPKQYW